jgi:hypothetical protein
MKTQPLLKASAIVLIALSAGCSETTESLVSPQFGRSSVIELVPVTVPAVSYTVSGIIDSKGGRLSDPLNGHEVKFDPRTVSEPTLVTMTTDAGNYIEVDLTAVSVSTGAAVTEFSRPVKLTLNWRNANLKNPNQLTVVYVPDDGSAMQPVSTVVDKTTKTAQGKLEHFSSYAAAIN